MTFNLHGVPSIHHIPSMVHDVSFSVHAKKGRGLWETVIEPQEWPDNHVDWSDYSPHATRSWGRGFFVLAQAASMLNLEHLRSFNVDAGVDGRPSGIV